VTFERLADGLLNAGLTPDDVEQLRPLVGSIAAALRGFAGGVFTHGWWIPGRLEVFGKHTDYAGGHSLVGAVPRGFVLAARGRQDGTVRLLDAGREQRVELVPPFDTHAFTGWRHYAHVAARRLARNFPDASIGADIVFASSLPSASGMSSSSALVVGIVTALSELAGLRTRPEWRENVRSRVDEAGYYACFENGLSFGTLRGDAGVGTHGGSEDHVAIVCGSAGQLGAWQFVPIRHVADVRVPDAWSFVIAASGVAAQKTGPARESYNRLAQLAADLLDTWNQVEPAQPSLHTALATSASAPDRLRHLLERSGQEGGRHAALSARLDHFLREDARVTEALDAFRTGNRAALGNLSADSQDDAETLLGNQVPETVALAQLARDHGAFAASSFGAGFGGSVWALVDRGEAPAFAERWSADYRARFPVRTAATTFISRPGPGLTRLE
jgi:galactokinase